MKDIFSLYGVNLTEAEEDKFSTYFDLLIEYNKRFNLTSITQREEVIKKHFLDSISGRTLFDSEKSCLEVGSGGGFPSIPLKIMRPDLKFTLLEATGKKCEFLNIVIQKLKLENVTVINGRAEELAKDTLHREKYDYCTARAVARLNTLCEYCMPFVKVGGRFMPYKSRDEKELIEGKKAIEILGGKYLFSKEYHIDDSMEKRCIYVIEKVKPTPEKYPRGQGKERKNPL